MTPKFSKLANQAAFFSSRRRTKSTAATERIGHGGATSQAANLCSNTNCAAESMVPDIDPEKVGKLAGWGLTRNDRARFVGWCPKFSAVGPVPHQPGFLIDFAP